MSENDETSRKDSDTDPHAQLLAMLGLLADHEQPYGSKPDMKEILHWHLGKLNPERAAEVKSHVARDPVCYQLWAEIRAAEQTNQERSDSPVQESGWLTRSRKAWRQIRYSWLIAGAITATVAISMLNILYFDKPWSPMDEKLLASAEMHWPYTGMTVTRSGELAYQQKIALQAGMRHGFATITHGQLGWEDIIGSLPDQQPVCDGVTDEYNCNRRLSTIYMVGTYVAANYLACIVSESGERKLPETYWHQQSEHWKTIYKQLDAGELPVITNSVAKLSEYRDSSVQCEAVRDLIYMSF